MKIPAVCGAITKESYAMFQYFLCYKDGDKQEVRGQDAMNVCISALKKLKAPKSLDHKVYAPFEQFPWLIPSEEAQWVAAFLKNLQKGKHADAKVASSAKSKAEAAVTEGGSSGSADMSPDMAAAMRKFGLSS